MHDANFPKWTGLERHSHYHFTEITTAVMRKDARIFPQLASVGARFYCAALRFQPSLPTLPQSRPAPFNSFAIIAFSLLGRTGSRGDTVVLKSGEKIEGENSSEDGGGGENETKAAASR